MKILIGGRDRHRNETASHGARGNRTAHSGIGAILTNDEKLDCTKKCCIAIVSRCDPSWAATLVDLPVCQYISMSIVVSLAKNTSTFTPFCYGRGDSGQLDCVAKTKDQILRAASPLRLTGYPGIRRAPRINPCSSWIPVIARIAFLITFWSVAVALQHVSLTSNLLIRMYWLPIPFFHRRLPLRFVSNGCIIASRMEFLAVPSTRPRPRSNSSSNQRLGSPLSLQSSQGLYRYSGQQNAWLPLQLQTLRSQDFSTRTFTKFQVITWNIEFSSPLITKRTAGILDYIHSRISASPAQSWDIPTIILFQEVHAEAFPAFLSHPFLQNHYDLTDISCENFASHYGTVSLIPQSLTPFVSAIARIPFRNSRMGRDALTIDLDLPHFPDFPRSFPSLPTTSKIRICNVHLESLRGHGDVARPEQLRFVSKLLSAADGGLVAGDMNPIAPTDDQVPHVLSLVDCWEVLHPQATEEEGHTWGYQPRSVRHPAGRLDKVLLSGGLAPHSIERFGVGQYVEHRWDNIWLSDHYGLLAEIRIV